MKGTCEFHGEFELSEGCSACQAEKRQNPVIATDKRGRQVEPEPTALATIEPVTENEEGHRHYKVAPEPLSDEARRKLTGGRDEMMEDATNETAMTLKPGEDVEVLSYYTEALKMREYAEARVIATLEDSKVATDDLSAIANLKKAMEGKRREYLDPLKVQVDAIRETYNYLMAPVLEADKITREKMVAFDAEQRRRRQEQEEINRKRMEAAEAEMKLKGELTEPVSLVEVAPEVKRVSTEMGTAGMTDHWKYEVTDFALLPDEYKVADSAMLNTVARKHHDQKPIPGVRFYNEPSITVRTK